MLDQCAACGKEIETLKTCCGCNSVKYCNADCQKAHRKQHKADCKKKAAEFEVALFEIGKRAAELFDEILFKKPPPREDCPICMLQLPFVSDTPNIYQTCCGKFLCCGCVGAMGAASDNCPFCRKPVPSSEMESIDRLNKRVEIGDANAFNMMGTGYTFGTSSLQKDTEKALEFFLRAAELGSMDAHNNIATMYYSGQLGVEIDREKFMYHWQQAAIEGDAVSRYNLGAFELKAGNIDRAMKHWMISAGMGLDGALDNIRLNFMNGNATKAQYETALRDHQAYFDEVKSYQRDVALKEKGMVGGKKWVKFSSGKNHAQT